MYACGISIRTRVTKGNRDMVAGGAFPVVDLAPFFTEDDSGARARAIEAVLEAGRTHGCFQAVNHGVPAELMARALKLSAAFFTLPDDEKARARQAEGTVSPIPPGYTRAPPHSGNKLESILVFDPKLGYNEYPAEPAGFREAVEECYAKFSELGQLLQEVLNECLGLPPGFLRGYNGDRNFDFMAVHHYYPATEEKNNGLSAHEDGNCITLVFQDSVGVGGLEILKDGEWVSAEPVQGSINVNIGDIIKVLSNNKFKSPTHRVVSKPVDRHSFAFFFNLHGDKWVEPLPEFTTKVGEAPRYRGFVLDEYLQRRMKAQLNPPTRPEDVVHNNNITYYAI